MNGREIKRRIASVKETVKITRAMYSISVAKTIKGRTVLPPASAFYDRCRSLMERFAATESPYFLKRGEKVAFIVIGGDKGLCGDYNQRICEYALAEMKKVSERFLFTVGTVTRDMLAKAGIEADMEFLHSAENPTPEAAYAMAADLMNLYDEGMLDEIRLLFSEVTDSHSEPISLTLLPFLTEQAAPLPREGIKEGAVKRGVYQYLAAALYRALVSASLAEHLARVKAMPQATENGEEMIANLTAKYNRMRQEGITRALQDASPSDSGYEQSV